MPDFSLYKKELTVGAESIDIQGHVNNREYMRWMEEAATEHATTFGWDWKTLVSMKRSWVAREHWIEYLKPCFEGDRLTVFTWLQAVRGPVCLRRYAVKKGEELAAIGATEWVFIDLERGRPVAIASPDKERFAALAYCASEVPFFRKSGRFFSSILSRFCTMCPIENSQPHHCWL